MSGTYRYAYVLMPAAMLALVLGIITGWERLGWQTARELPHGEHGGLMVACFLGGLVMLERAVAIGKPWSYSGSALCAVGLILFLLDLPYLATVSITLAAAVYVFMLVRQQSMHHEKSNLISLLGAFCLLTGNALLLIHDLYPISVNWWMGFLLFTILGERLSLSQELSSGNIWSLILVILVITGLLLPFHGAGAPVFGSGLLLTGLWLLFSERYSFRINKLKRYMNLAIVFACGWLVVTGTLLLADPTYYDALLHSFFVGFTFSMIFAHAPMMVPRVFRFDAKLYHPAFYYLLIALQLSLISRILGSLQGHELMIRWGGLLNGVIILAFLLTMALVVWSGRREIRFNKRIQP